MAAETAEKCEDCGTVTDRWVRGWDGRFRCLTHAANGRLGAKPHHCPTCTCVNAAVVVTRPAVPCCDEGMTCLECDPDATFAEFVNPPGGES